MWLNFFFYVSFVNVSFSTLDYRAILCCSLISNAWHISALIKKIRHVLILKKVD